MEISETKLSIAEMGFVTYTLTHTHIYLNEHTHTHTQTHMHALDHTYILLTHRHGHGHTHINTCLHGLANNLTGPPTPINTRPRFGTVPNRPLPPLFFLRSLSYLFLPLNTQKRFALRISSCSLVYITPPQLVSTRFPLTITFFIFLNF